MSGYEKEIKKQEEQKNKIRERYKGVDRNELEFIHHVSEKYDCGVEIDPDEMDDFQARKFIAEFVHNAYCQILEDYQKRCSEEDTEFN